MSNNALIFVDCEATGPCPGKGELTEFGAVAYPSKETFHGILAESSPTEEYLALSKVTGKRYDPVKVFSDFKEWLEKVNNKKRVIFVSDNPAFDWQWINYGFHHHVGENPFGHSGRRISDFYAGLVHDFYETQGWKKFRITPHDHNPVNDAMGNVEAFEKLLQGEV